MDIGLSSIVDTEKLDSLRDANARDTIQQAVINSLTEQVELYLTPGADSHFDYPDRAEERWLTRAGGKASLTIVENLATAWRVTGNDKYRDAAVRVLMTIVDEDFAFRCGGASYGRPYRTWCNDILDAGLAAGSIAVSLDMLHDILSEEQQERAESYFIRIFDYLLDEVKKPQGDPEGKRPAHNIPTIGNSGMGALALILSDRALSSERRQEALDLARKRAFLFLEKGHDGDGAPWEGAGYCSATLRCIMPMAVGMARAGQRELIDHPGWGRIALGILSEMIPSTGNINPLNDTHEETFHIVDWFFAISSFQKDTDPEIAAACGLLGRRMLKLDIGSPCLVPFADTCAADASRILIFHDSSAPARLPGEDRLPLCRHFKGRSLVDIRTGWETNDYFVSFICDASETWGHTQADRGHFSFYALGEYFATDSGYCTERIQGTSEVIRWGACGGSHNVPIVHGQMQQMGPRDRTRMLHVDLDQWAKYASCQAPDAYLGVDEFTRKLVFVPPLDGLDGYLIVADRIDANKIMAPLFTFPLHTDPGNKIDIISHTNVRLTGARQGACCDVHMVANWYGRWAEDHWVDHPRLRFDFSLHWTPRPFPVLSPLMLMLPFASDEQAPKVDLSRRSNGQTGAKVDVCMGGREGLGMVIEQSGYRDIIVHTTGQDNERGKPLADTRRGQAGFSMEGLEVVGGLGMVRVRDGRVKRFFGADVVNVRFLEHKLHESGGPVPFVCE